LGEKKYNKKTTARARGLFFAKGCKETKRELFSFSLRLFVALSLFDLMPIDDD